MQLYIDSNIYLEYFRENSAERLTPLKELVRLIESKKIELLLPSQTKQEYFRNRRKIAELTRIALVKQSNLSSMIPAVIDKEDKEVKKVLKNTKELVKSYKELIDKYDKAVEKEKTDADILIKKLFELAREIKDTDDILHNAYTRYMKGNPPRKNDHSYGDAVIWETILKEGAIDDLVLITKDGDFTEIYKNNSVLNNFLFIEWRIKTKKKKKATLYKSLAEFVNTFDKKEVIKEEIVQKEKQDSALLDNIDNYYTKIQALGPQLVPMNTTSNLKNFSNKIQDFPINGINVSGIEFTDSSAMVNFPKNQFGTASNGIITFGDNFSLSNEINSSSGISLLQNCPNCGTLRISQKSTNCLRCGFIF